MDRTAAYEAADGSSSLPEGTMEPWQRWSMRGTENPENEVRVLGVPQEYMVSELRWKSAGLWLRWPRVRFPSDTQDNGDIAQRQSNGLLIRGPEVQIHWGFEPNIDYQ